MADQNMNPGASSAPFDAPLDTLGAVAACLAAAFESGDADLVSLTLRAVADSAGLAHLAAAASLPRAQLADAMRAGEMSLDTTLAIMKVIDLHMPGDPGATHGPGHA